MIDLNKPHITLQANHKGLWDVYYPRGNLIVGATDFASYGKALSYAHFLAADLKMPLRQIKG